MALIRGVETPLISRFFSGRMHTMPHAVQILRNKLKQRGPNFLEEIEEPARTAMERARAKASRRRPIALIEAPRLHTKPPSARSPSPKSSSARSPSPKSSSPKPSSPKSPKEDKSGGRGRTSITYRRKSHSSRKIKCHASKTQRYRRFIKM
jgi:hypothetical protein